jgi:hypothetical protein
MKQGSHKHSDPVGYKSPEEKLDASLTVQLTCDDAEAVRERARDLRVRPAAWIRGIIKQALTNATPAH